MRSLVILSPGKKRLIACEIWARSHDLFTGLGPAIALVVAVYQVKVYYDTDFHKCETFFYLFNRRFQFLRIHKWSERYNQNIS